MYLNREYLALKLKYLLFRDFWAQVCNSMVHGPFGKNAAMLIEPTVARKVSKAPKNNTWKHDYSPPETLNPKPETLNPKP